MHSSRLLPEVIAVHENSAVLDGEEPAIKRCSSAHRPLPETVSYYRQARGGRTASNTDVNNFAQQ